ncbi:MAG TPA: ABC transporter permease [Ignavibacteria bacterium]|nr:ABC transporter permease [Ignavibacteria bacterium]
MNFFSEIKENILISFNAINANKLRSLLATLGIVIGITAVTLMQTAIEGINRAFEKSIAAVGADVLYVQKFEWFGKEDWSFYKNRKDITMQQYDFLNVNSQTSAIMAPSVGTNRTLRYRDLVLQNVFVLGSTWEYQEVSGFNMAEGRYFTQRETDGGYPVCVIGTDIRDAFFPNTDPLGKTIKVGTYSFKIIGVVAKQGSLLGLFSLDNRVIVPIERFFTLFGDKRGLTINVKAADINNLEETKEEIKGLMRKARKVPYGQPDDFGINAQEAFQTTYESLTGLIKVIGTMITMLALIVGSVGIANIMFVSVKERTREIGIRKALGAKKRTIRFQFLIESSMICLLGGIIGLLIAFPISLLIDALVLPTSMPLWIVALAIFISLLFGILAGFFPAYSAAKMDPVDSLRYE